MVNTNIVQINDQGEALLLKTTTNNIKYIFIYIFIYKYIYI
jgi:hypothetical protein